MFYSSSTWGHINTFHFVWKICYTLQKYFLMHRFIACVEGVCMSRMPIILFPIKAEKEKKKECLQTLSCTHFVVSTVNSHSRSFLSSFILLSPQCMFNTVNQFSSHPSHS